MFFHLLAHYKYTALFLGLFVGGDTALLVGIYFSLIGVMSLWYVVSLAFMASLLADSVWYWVGMSLTYEKIKRLPYFRNQVKQVNAMESFLNKHALKAVFYSKFVYGARTIIQIIAGAHGVKLSNYFTINVTGTALWIAAFLLIGKTLDANLQAFRHVAHGIEFVFAIIVIFVVIIHIVVKSIVAKKIADIK